MPAMSVEDAVERYGLLVQFVSTLLKADIDYGQIPGTNKPTLLKPGAEKLLTFFGLTKRFTLLEKVEDWIGDAHGGPFFYYMYRSALYNGDQLIAESDGSCNSHESKYRYRKAERECPACGGAFIIKGKAEYGGGWLCFAKKGGCGAKFRDGDAVIEGQQVGRVVNPDIADQVNTIQKMAQKRALIAATLLAVNASEFFTQDLEDMAIDGEIVEPNGGKHKPQDVIDAEPDIDTAILRGKAPQPQQGRPVRPKGNAGQIVALAEALQWNDKRLAGEVYDRFKLDIVTDVVAGLEALPKLQQLELIQAMKGELAQRAQATGGK